MADPLVTILITSHNYERFLSAAIESALHQDYSSVEVLVVDDGSTDGSVALAKSFPVKVLALPHHGLAAAMLEGVRQAKGDFVGILNADDLLHPTFASSAMAALAGRAHAFAYVGSYLFGPHVQGGRGGLRMRAKRFSPKSLRRGPSMVCAGPLPKQAILDVGGYDASLPVLEDWDFWLRVVEAGYTGVPIDRPLYYYRQHSPKSRNRTNQRRNTSVRKLIWKRHGGVGLGGRLLYGTRTARLALLFMASLWSWKATRGAASWLSLHDPFPGPLLEPVPRQEAEPTFPWVQETCCRHASQGPGVRTRP